MRRTKDEVLRELPPKLIHDEPLELTAEQRESYRLAEEEGVLRLTELGAAATIHHVFELVLRLKQICNFDPPTGASTKFERLEANLEEIAGSGRKAIVFSQWVVTLRRLAEQLDRFGPLEYHGKVPQRRRDGVIQRFREDPDKHVLLMSYGAGGVGLNLQFVNYVFLFDRWWNPAVEDQAINRAHRIGVDGPVTVTRLLDARYDRGTDRSHSAREARSVRHHLLRRRGPPQARADAGRTFWAVPVAVPVRPDRPGGVSRSGKAAMGKPRPLVAALQGN